jgi:two-component system LytT family sensor kinase
MTSAAAELTLGANRAAAKRRPREPRALLLIFGGWSLVAIIFAVHNYLTFGADGRAIPFVHALWWSGAEWYTWAALTPLAVHICRRWPVAGARALPHAAVLLLAAALLAVLQVALEYSLDRAVTLLSASPTLSVRYWLSDGASTAAMELSYLLPRKTGFAFATACALVAAIHTVDYYRMYRDRELQAARLRSALASAQLERLRAQLQPHFLFNTLNGIASLIPEDPAAAEEMVECLSDLLRASLGPGTRAEVTLAEELHLLDQYLTIQQLRFQDRLRITREIEPDVLEARVPPLLLQPLAENAVRHAVAKRVEGGRLHLVARKRSDTLQILLLDDGPGIGDPGAMREGVGLTNTRERLHHLYGGGAALELGDRPEGGARVLVSLPLSIDRARAG